MYLYNCRFRGNSTKEIPTGVFWVAFTAVVNVPYTSTDGGSGAHIHQECCHFRGLHSIDGHSIDFIKNQNPGTKSVATRKICPSGGNGSNLQGRILFRPIPIIQERRFIPYSNLADKLSTEKSTQIQYQRYSNLVVLRTNRPCHERLLLGR